MAIRTIAPEHFECEAAYAPAAFNERGGIRTFKGAEVEQLLKKGNLPMKTDLYEAMLPIGLRWRLKPGLGLPFTPFNVWRKDKKSPLPLTPIALFPTSAGVLFLNGPFFRAVLVLKNNGATAMPVTITPLNPKYKENGGKATTVNISAGATATAQIDQPNMGGVRLSGGSFAVQSASGIGMQAYLNDPGWTLIQVVGLPFKTGSIDPNLYKPDQQGFVNTLTDAETACKQRVDLYRLFYKNPAATASDGTALPLFEIPTGSELLSAYNKTALVKNGKTGVLNDIAEMLQKVYKTSPQFYLGMQKNFLKEIKTKGAVDPANSNPKDNGTYRNPVCSTILLSGGTDCWNALGLGFGTMDFLPYANVVLGSSVWHGDLYAFDYMITAQFRMPVIDYIYPLPFTHKQKLTGFEEIEYAALCHFDIQQPPAPMSLLAENISENRPLLRDDNYYENVRVSWLKPAIEDRSPLCYAIAFKNNMGGGAVQFLNNDRVYIPNKPQPYTPAIRSDADAEDVSGRESNAFERFYHNRSPVPFIGSVTQQYYVAAQNVFGLWSNWSIASDTLVANPPQVPRIVSAAFKTAHEGITNHNYAGSTLEIVVSYDWQDRTPFEIQLAGYFVLPPIPTPPVSVAGITRSNSGGVIDRYVLRFTGSTPVLGKLDAANNFVAVAAAEGSVTIDASPSSGTSNGQASTATADVRTYRVKLKQMTLNFSSQTRLWYTLYSRAAEAKNPALFSAYSNQNPTTLAVDPARVTVINVADPVARPAPTFSPAINWASLPDATNTSRFHLQIPAVTGAVGYAVYRATEMSLRDRLNGIVNYPANGSLFQRRDALNGASPADKKRAVDAFIRVNKKLLTTTEVELEMNGDTGGLFIYAVSSFTDQNAESPLSDWIYVAVPEKITPAPPTLTGYVNKKLPIPKLVLKVDLGAGNNTSTVEIFRTSKKYLGADINLMGLPVKTGPAAGWGKYKTVDGVNDLPVVDPAARFDYYKLEEDAAPGWAPLYYRAVGLGLNQPTNGKLPGRSPSSNLLQILPPVPALPPALNSAALLPNAALTMLRLSFASNAYVGRSPYGMHTLFVFKQNTNGLWDELKGGDIPELKKLSAGDPEPPNDLVRLQTDAAGFSAYALNLPVQNKIALKIVVADPLGRKSEAVVNYTKPTSPKAIITNVLVQQFAAQVSVTFKTSVGKTKPLIGQFTLSIIALKGHTSKAMLIVAMHQIPDKLPFFVVNAAIAGGTTQDADQLYSYGAVFKGAANLQALAGATVYIQITDPKGNKIEGHS